MRWLLFPSALALCVLGCGSGSSSTKSAPSKTAGGTPTSRTSVQAAPSAARIRVTRIGSLPAALQDPASAPLDGGRVALLGGLDAADVSTSSIKLFSGPGAVPGGTLPVAQHDAQGARLGRYVYVFGGGGATSSFDHILRYDPASQSVTQAGKLPVALSDVGVAAVGDTAYVVGGYDGTRSVNTILAWKPGTSARPVAHLPVALRYAAVASAGNSLLIAGGTTPTGVSDAIFSFDPSAGAVTRLGRLPVALTHAAAAASSGEVLVIGGRRSISGGQSASLFAVDPSSGTARRVGRLPGPLSDAAAATVGSAVIVAGGSDGSATQRSVFALRPA